MAETIDKPDAMSDRLENQSDNQYEASLNLVAEALKNSADIDRLSLPRMTAAGAVLPLQLLYGNETEMECTNNDAVKTLNNSSMEVHAETPSEKAIDKAMVELENEYNIKFETPQDSSYGDRVRKPTLEEIADMKAALEKSPTAIRESGIFFSERPLKISFLKPGEKDEPLAQHQLAVPRIVVFGKTNRSSFQSAFIHELAHHEDRNIEPFDATKIGWRQAIDANTGEKKDLWLFEAKDGSLYRMKEEPGKISWIRSDENGNDLKPNEPDGRLTNRQMYERAKMRPATEYFYLKYEMVADALEMYRRDMKSNLELYRNNPELYRIVRDYDQKRLDSKYGGILPWSSPYMYRDIDGQVRSIPPDGTKRTAESEIEKTAIQGVEGSISGAQSYVSAEAASVLASRKH